MKLKFPKWKFWKFSGPPVAGTALIHNKAIIKGSALTRGLNKATVSDSSFYNKLSKQTLEAKGYEIFNLKDIESYNSFSPITTTEKSEAAALFSLVLKYLEFKKKLPKGMLLDNHSLIMFFRTATFEYYPSNEVLERFIKLFERKSQTQKERRNGEQGKQD